MPLIRQLRQHAPRPLAICTNAIGNGSRPSGFVRASGFGVVVESCGVGGVGDVGGIGGGDVAGFDGARGTTVGGDASGVVDGSGGGVACDASAPTTAMTRTVPS